MEVGNKLNPQRSYRKGFALKGLRQHIIKTNNPSTIGPGELLTVRFPDLKENQVIIPSTTKLTFNITLAGTDVNRTIVGNLGRNIIRKLVVKLEGNEIISIDDYDILYSYYDCWKTATERRNAVFQGIVEADSQGIRTITPQTITPWTITPQTITPRQIPPDNYPPRTNTPRTFTPPEKFFKHLPWYSLYLYSSYSFLLGRTKYPFYVSYHKPFCVL